MNVGFQADPRRSFVTSREASLEEHIRKTIRSAYPSTTHATDGVRRNYARKLTSQKYNNKTT